MFSQWNVALGMLAAYLYASNGIFYDLVSFALLLLLGHSARPSSCSARCSSPTGGRRKRPRGWRWRALPSASACGCADRGGRCRCSCAAWRPGSRRCGRTGRPGRRCLPIVAPPQVIRSTRARGQLTFTTRAVWHVALVGLGYYPNPTVSRQGRDDLRADAAEVRSHVQIRGLLRCTTRRRRRNSCRSGRRTRHL